MPRRRPEFTPGEAGAEADKLKKFIDAGGPQMQWLFDVGRTNFRITSGIRAPVFLSHNIALYFIFAFFLSLSIDLVNIDMGFLKFKLSHFISLVSFFFFFFS